MANLEEFTTYKNTLMKAICTSDAIVDLLKLDTAGSTETGMTFSAEDHRVTAVGTFEAVISEVHGIAKQGTLNIV